MKMRRLNWQILLGLSLAVLSVFFYLVHYLIFRDAHHIFIYVLGDIAFIPIEVLIVTLIIHKLLSRREKNALLHKLNMVIGAFFSEVGSRLLESFSGFDPYADKIGKDLIVTNDWSEYTFSQVSSRMKRSDYTIESQRGDLESLRTFLLGKRDFLLRLMENPNLLEHESFTELLWAVFHLTEELGWRGNMKELSHTDSEHLAGDIKRAYSLLIAEWLGYMRHLKNNYPYLFSLAIRTNPFDPNRSPEVK